MPQKQEATAENENVNPATTAEVALQGAYGIDQNGKDEAAYSLGEIQKINDALALRERNSLVSNGISYTRAYLYNQQKAINYAPPRNPKDDREVSAGIVHEKIVAFISLFIRYSFRRRIRAFDKEGKVIDGLGDLYDLAIEFSQRAEQFVKKIALIYWEVFTQGNAFVLEDWDVRTITEQIAIGLDGQEVTPDKMDFTYEFLEGLTYKDGKQIQKRMAVSRLLDGRMVIFDNPEEVDINKQAVTIEEDLSRADAEQLYGTLKRWKSIPSDKTQIDLITPEKTTLFSSSRLAKPKTRVIVHRRFDPINNRFNVWLNGIMLLPRNTPLTLFYPRGNTPLSNIPAERLTGSIYSRSIPAKTKFNADFIDWALKNLALKFEQGVVPAILAKGKYTISRKMFRSGEVTHGVTTQDYEKADKDNKGVTAPEFGFVNMLKDLVEAQTLNPTTLGELQPGASATEINITDQNQREKLGFLLDGIAGGFMDMALRRCETIESKYTLKQKETVVDGKRIGVYQNFSVNVGGVQHNVIFDDALGDPLLYHEDAEALKQKRSDLHQQSFKAKQAGKPSEFYIVDPVSLREGMPHIDVEIVPERIKETGIRMEEMWNEFTQLLNTFGKNVNMEELKSIYLETRGRPSSIFNSADVMKLDEITAQGVGAFGTPGATEGAPAAKVAAMPAKKRPALM